MHRSVLTFFLAVFSIAAAFGQQAANLARPVEPRRTEGFIPMPNEINYQGVITTGSGAPADGIYSLQFDLFFTSGGGISIWTETHGAVTVQNGTFNVRLGTLTPLPYFVTPYFLQVTANSGPGIGAPVVFSPRDELGAAPYALGPWHQYGFALTAPYYWVGIGIDTPYTTLTVNGSVGFTNASSPMLFVYQSGIDNADRMVIAHSPAWTNYGLEYKDLVDYMSFVGALGEALTIDLDGRRIGVGQGATNLSTLSALTSATSRRYGGYFTTDSASGLSRALFAEYTGGGSNDGVGVYGRSVPADWFGYGGYFVGGWRGVYGSVTATGSNGYTGVFGQVSGGTGTNYGVYGAASGGSTRYGVYGSSGVADNSYAGYFSGRLRVSSAVGDSAVMLPDGAISSPEILDEPGIAQDVSTATVYLDGTTSMTNIDTVVISVPGPGYVVVEARSTAFFRNTTGINQIFVQIDTVAGGSLVNPYFTRAGLDAYASTAGFNYIPVSVSRVFPVSDAGTHTYRFLGLEGFGNEALGVCGVFQSLIRATYYPTSYGSVAQSVNPSAVVAPLDRTGGESQSSDMRTLELRAAQARIAAQAAELELLKARQAQEQSKDPLMRDDR